MTRQEFIEQHRHKIGGMILDAATAGARGETLSLFVRGLLRTVDVELGKMFDALQPATARETIPIKAPKQA